MLSQLVHLSREMLTLAEQGEWERLTAAQTERRQLMDAVFPLDSRLQDAEDAVAQIQLIQELDQQITRLVRAQQQQIGQELGKLNQGRAATRAYQDTSSR